MTTKVSPLGLRVFLEGIEVPGISAQVNIMPDQPATAAIQIIPTDMAMHLLPRTLVHLFYLDADAVLPDPPPKPRISESGEEESNPGRFAARDDQYKLLFAGEMIGYNYGKNPSSRQLVLQCMDLSSYWDTCYQWFADYSVGGNGLTDKSYNFVGAGASMFNSVAGGTQWVLGRLLNTKPRSKEFQNLKGLLGGIVHVLEAVGGIRYKSDGEPGFNGVNDFFTIAELRYNLLGMVGALEEDTTSAKMYGNKAFRAWLKNGMTSLGTLMSFRDMINHINRLIFHHVYPCPVAYFKQGAEGVRKVNEPTSMYTDDPGGGYAKSLIRNATRALTRAENVFLPISEGDSDSESFSLGVKELDTTLTSIDLAAEQIDNIKTDDQIDVTSNLAIARSLTDQARKTVDEAGFVRSGDAGISDVAIGNVKATAAKILPFINDAIETLKYDILGQTARARRSVNKEVITLDGARLHSQLILPETFFVAPPRCNVIFPDQYYQFSFSRNFMREVTRLSCRGGLGMIAGGRQGAKLLGSHYYAPDLRDVRGKHLFATSSKGARILLPHEIHSGIIPKFEHITDGHRWGAKAAKDSGKSDAFHQAGKVGYIQRLANFQFFMHRWSSRSMSITGKFNPYLVAGLPALVMDRSMPAPAVVKKFQQVLGRTWLPMQYLGRIATLTHSLNQGTGETSANFMYCRTHRGLDDEFLGSLAREVETRGTKTEKVKFTTLDLVSAYKSEQEINEMLSTDEGRAEIFRAPEGGRKILKNRDDLRELVALYIQGKLDKGSRVQGTKKYRGFRVRDIVTSDTVVDLDGATAESVFGLDTNETVTVERKEFRRVGTVTEKVYRDTVFKIPLTNIPLTTISGDAEVEIGGEYKEVDVTETFETLRVPETFEITFAYQAGTGEWVRVDRTVEQALTPGWYSDIWTNEKVGEKVYNPLLGIGAITDDVTLAREAQDTIIDKQFKEELAKTVVKGETAYKVEQTDVIGNKLTELFVSPGSIEEAIDSITVLYGLIRSKGGDMHDFIRDYTKRDVANLEQVLGSQNLEYTDDGNINPDLPADVIEGFHSRAFGDYNVGVKIPDREGSELVAGKDAGKALFPGVPLSELTKRTARTGMIDRGEPPSAITPALDPRGRARARVRAYIDELRVSRGLMG